MKRALRQQIRAQKSVFSPEQLKEMSHDAITKLIHHPLYENAHTVLLYHSLADEVDTHALIEEACKSKKVLLPTVVGDELELHEYTPSATTHRGSFNIIESEGELFTDYENIELAVIPGMAFDGNGNRLGRGKGYYDRLLPMLHCPLIGICFPFQFLDNIPTERHDMSVDYVLH